MNLERLPSSPDKPLFKSSFVPDDADLRGSAGVSALTEALLARPLPDAAALRDWLQDWDAVARAVWGQWGRAMLEMNRNTRDEAAAQRYQRLHAGLIQRWHEAQDQLNQRFLAHPLRDALGAEVSRLVQLKRAQRATFHEDNGPLFAAINDQITAYQRQAGEVMVSLGDETLTPSVARQQLSAPDRARREAAWRAISQAHIALAADVSPVLDELVRLRDQCARNAGFSDYVAYHFTVADRVDYTPDDLARFSESIEAVAVPRYERLCALIQSRLGVERLRPWDTSLSLVNTPHETDAKLFSTESELIALARQMFADVDPELSADFQRLERHHLLDLMNRPAKAPGGYCLTLEDIGMPFIFANLVGGWRDLRVLLHEGGHALHALAARDQPFFEYRSAPAEFSEVASMGMELLAMERQSALPPDVARAQRAHQLSGVIPLFLQVALIDGFQVWMYRNPEHTAAERQQVWFERFNRLFSSGLDWTGLTQSIEVRWASIPHLFTHPLYFVEYGIAQLGALQLWQAARTDPKTAASRYRQALALGGSQPLPALFAAAGLRFSMEPALLATLLDDVLDALTETLATN